ncbi:hypothetical protein [Terrimonas alba]|uniref:hypothetical protein n=1 Tax=Terrimonas alba TaxID=3349636 RepID=UPI0035F32BEF
MNVPVNEITKSLTGKLSLRDCSIDELQQLVNKYPFFGPAQLLFAKKLKDQNTSSDNKHIQRASLFFQNPVWFDHLINDKTDYAIVEKKDEPFAFNVNTKMEIPATVEEVVDQTYSHKTQKENDEPIDEEVPLENQPALEIPKLKIEPIDPSKAELSFEPYHTIDYFASQGIKPKEEEKPRDSFSKQLKSFTEWLKVMKRLPVSEIAADISPADEKKVEKMAEVSINDREVVTETMAEVWEKQGNAQKATEVYRKLSLLNPAKSSYFAAKIEQLKNL